MADQQKREFIQALKRLKAFFNELKEYQPSEQTLAVRDFIDVDLEQPNFQIFELPEGAHGQDAASYAATMKDNQAKDQKVLEVVMDPKNQAPDEQFIKDAMQVTQEDMRVQSKSDQMWFEDAANTIRQARKFQYLIQKQENKICKEQIKSKQA
jgi:hypothetical protein